MIARAYGRLIDSDIELPGIQASGPADLRLILGEVRSFETGWANVWAPTDRAPWVRVRRDGADYTIRYEQQVDFHYSTGDRVITIHVHDCAPEILGHFILDQILPLVLSLEAPVLHASAVVVDDRAIAFSGKGGCGKSTLALMLDRQGYPIVCDDALLVKAVDGRSAAVPSYPGLRFWPDIATAVTRPPFNGVGMRKLRVAEGLTFQSQPVPLEHVLVIDAEESQQPSFEPLSGRDTAVAILGNSYRLEQRDGRVLAAELDRALGLSGRLAGCRFRYPRRAEAWSEIAAAVVAYVRSAAARSRPPSRALRRASPCCS